MHNQVPHRHVIEFDGGFLQRGFWLYIWEVTTPKGEKLHYVGRTGDNSTPNAQSPYVRMGQHLGSERRADQSQNTTNMLRKHLRKEPWKLNPEKCKFRLIANGPFAAETQEKTMEAHKPLRNKMAALEQELAKHMKEAGYTLLNEVRSEFQADEQSIQQVIALFAKDFDKLGPCNDKA